MLMSEPTGVGTPVASSGQTAAGSSAPAGSALGPAAGSGAASPPRSSAVGGASTTLNLAGAPQYTRFVRLTNGQWARSVQDILQLESQVQLADSFQSPVAGTTDFTNNELVLNVDQRAASDFQAAAESLADSVTASDAMFARAYPGTDATGLIQVLGRRAYRRPLTAAEQSTYRALFDQGAALSGPGSAFLKGARLVIRALLQSPHFLYRTERSNTGAPLDAYEIAAKLSLWLRGTTPSDALAKRLLLVPYPLSVIVSLCLGAAAAPQPFFDRTPQPPSGSPRSRRSPARPSGRRFGMGDPEAAHPPQRPCAG